MDPLANPSNLSRVFPFVQIASGLTMVMLPGAFFLAGNFVAVPNQLTQLRLADYLVGKSKLLGPDPAENDATHCCFNDFLLDVSVNRLSALIWVGKANAVVDGHSAIIMREHDFLFGAKEFQGRIFRAAQIPWLDR